MRSLIALLALLCYAQPAAAQPFSSDPANTTVGWKPARPDLRLRQPGPVMLLPPVTGLPGFGTWNPADNNGVVLSNGNLTATPPDSTARFVRSTSSNTGTLKYFEIRCDNNAVEYNLDIVLGTTASPLSSTIGASGDTTSYLFIPSVSNSFMVYYNGGVATTGLARVCASGEWLGFAVDLNLSKVWIANLTQDGTSPPWWDYPSGGDNPATGNGGFSIATGISPTTTVYILVGQKSPAAATLNTGATPFVLVTGGGSLPAGFTAWH